MARKQLIVWGSALVLTAVVAQVCVPEEAPQISRDSAIVTLEDKNAKSDERPNAKPVNPGAVTERVRAASTNKGDQSADRNRTTDEKAILLTGEAFVMAYNNSDATTIAEGFTSDAEYIDEKGYVFQGRAAIEKAFSACFAANQGAQLELNIQSIRFVSPGVAVEDGTTIVTSKKMTSGPIETNYTAFHVKIDGQWRAVSVREQAPPQDRRQHRAQLKQLAWLLGDWVDEGLDSLVMSSCKAIQGGNFLLREFRIHVSGQATVGGEQRIGWDPLTGNLKSWTFDSDGGYSEGVWNRDDNRWILKSVGVSADGRPASCMTIYTVIDDDTMTWQTVEHEADGVQYPDSDVVTIVRRAPPPKLEDDNLTSKSR